MKNIKIAIGVFTSMIFLFGWLVCADAASPWKWKYSLKNLGKGIPVKLPTTVYVDKEKGRYYVADAGSGGIHAYDKESKYLNTLKLGDALDQPFAMVRDGKGVLWIVEKGKNSLTKIDLKARKITPNSLQVKERNVFPDRMMLYEGAFYILDKFSGDILVFNEDMQNLRTYSCDDCSGGFIDFVVKGGGVWGLAKHENSVYSYNIKGKFLGKIQLKEKLAFPYAIEIGPSGLLYVLDRHEGAVNVFGQSGEYKYRFLGKGHERGNLFYPEDLLFDPWGRLCVVDAGNGRVEVFSR